MALKKKAWLIGVCAAGVCLAFAGCAQAQNGEEDSRSSSSQSSQSQESSYTEESQTGGWGDTDDGTESGVNSNGVDGISTEDQDAARNAANTYFTSKDVEIESMEVQEQSGLYDEYLDSYGAGNVLVFRAYAVGNANPRYVVLTRADTASEWSVIHEIE